jgi:hypothetical protein
MASVNLAIGLIKIFKYLRFFSRVTIMWDALAAAFPELLTLGLAYIVLTLAFALCGHLLFGAWAQTFHSISASVSTALRSITGDFNYEEVCIMCMCIPVVSTPREMKLHLCPLVAVVCGIRRSIVERPTLCVCQRKFCHLL